ncbi:MAG TPA: hypothetical protein VK874_09005 [Gaiellaceae bacterium]|nr:hypothetical protein [Gaiellaceae bacterium]
MNGYDEVRLAELIAALPTPPDAWVEAAQELPRFRARADEILVRAEADAAFRRRLLEDLEAALAGEGYEPHRRLVDVLRARLAD